MLTDEDVIADLSRLRERSEGIEYAGDVPLTRRSAAATIVPVAALAAATTVGAVAVTGSGDGGSGAGSSTTPSAGSTTGDAQSSPATTGPSGDAIKLVNAKITLGSKTISYRHAVGADPFGEGWQLAIEFGASLPADATRFDLGGGEVAWVADSPDPSRGRSVLIAQAGPHDEYIGAPSSFSRADLEEFVSTNLHGVQG